MQASWDAARYEKVFLHLRDQVDAGVLRPGQRLPGERRLADQLGVSRDTVREGLRLAEDAGLIVRVPARGTFIAEQRIRQDLGRMRSFDLTVRGANLAPTYASVAVAARAADPREARALEVPAGTSVTTLEAVGMGDGRPLAHYRSVIPGWVAQRLPADPDWHGRSTYQLIAAALDVPSLLVEQRWEAMALPADVGAALGIDTDAPAFRSTSVFRTPDAQPVELRTAWYPGSRYEFTISRTIDLAT